MAVNLIKGFHINCQKAHTRSEVSITHGLPYVLLIPLLYGREGGRGDGFFFFFTNTAGQWITKTFRIPLLFSFSSFMFFLGGGGAAKNEWWGGECGGVEKKEGDEGGRAEEEWSGVLWSGVECCGVEWSGGRKLVIYFQLVSFF